MNSRKLLKPVVALVLALVSVVGAAPFNLYATANAAESPAETPYFYLDGERISFDDERVLNVVTVQKPKPSRTRAAGGGAPNVEYIAGLDGEFERKPDISMNGSRVYAGRYVAVIDGIAYEAFCGDPKLRGPENASAIYALSGEAASYYSHALKNGYPVNSEWSNPDVEQEERMYWAYITRVAVAMANNPNNTFTGDEDVLAHARQLESGGMSADPDLHAIMLNGEKDASDSGRTINDAAAQSEPFVLSYNRKLSNAYNQFRFEWAAGTPDGAKIIADGTVILTS